MTDKSKSSIERISLLDAFDFDLLIDTLKKLKEGKNVQVPFFFGNDIIYINSQQIPIYDFTTHKRTKIPVREKSACI